MEWRNDGMVERKVRNQRGEARRKKQEVGNKKAEPAL